MNRSNWSRITTATEIASFLCRFSPRARIVTRGGAEGHRRGGGRSSPDCQGLRPNESGEEAPQRQPRHDVEVVVKGNQFSSDFEGVSRDPYIVRRNRRSLPPQVGSDPAITVGGCPGDRLDRNQRLCQQALQLRKILLVAPSIAKPEKELPQDNRGHEELLGSAGRLRDL